ncbi:hypothetical protein CERSUDRAFT_107993 [Gelatoporia subvermispora B]|uniref:Uncharacterized protein n=1 Tax=Ceriporiopsis subvermispora (strain B) TaxID=914234 RepID=M2PD58_CERS8|nr:hypothetical protein CERSUDRAFT_107993 [Gelatoporia subvermispora B]
MFIPLLTPRNELVARKGGGGGHGSSSSGHSSGHSEGSSAKSSSSKTSSASGQRSVPLSGATGGKSTAEAYGPGGGRAATIPVGQPFGGRTAGGGTRAQVYGSSYYGSGYPGITGIGVDDRNFPFVYWPVVWTPGYSYYPPYITHTGYGRADNTSRVGGPMATAIFSSDSNNSTFRILADNSTVASLITSIHANCSYSGSSSTAPTPYNGSATSWPLPEQVIQYYRASSATLSLDSYNNTDALQGSTTTAIPLPSWVDTVLLDCLNNTIGEAIPLVSGAGINTNLPPLNAAAFVCILFWLFSALA